MIHGFDTLNFYVTGKKSHLRKTLKKYPLEQQTIHKIQQSKIWKMEHEFYEFVKGHFHYLKQQTFDVVNGEYVEKGHRYMYEKIRPRLVKSILFTFIFESNFTCGLDINPRLGLNHLVAPEGIQTRHLPHAR